MGNLQKCTVCKTCWMWRSRIRRSPAKVTSAKTSRLPRLQKLKGKEKPEDCQWQRSTWRSPFLWWSPRIFPLSQSYYYLVISILSLLGYLNFIITGLNQSDHKRCLPQVWGHSARLTQLKRAKSKVWVFSIIALLQGATLVTCRLTLSITTILPKTTRSGLLNCKLRGDEAEYWASKGQQWLVLGGTQSV